MELGRDSDTGGQVFAGHNIFLVYGNKAKFVFFFFNTVTCICIYVSWLYEHIIRSNMW